MLIVAAALVLVSCSRGEIQGRVRIPAASVASPKDPTAQPRILSARLAHPRAAELGGLDGALVVFSEELDPASLAPRMLLVVSKAGHRMPPERALLSPARFGETRTVLLVGDFTKEGREPSDVIVVGPLYTSGGTSLRGLSHPFDPLDAPRRVVAAERLPVSAGSCAGASQRVRTYWSAPVGSDERVDLAAVRLGLHDGTEIVPEAVERGSVEPPAQGSNVLDLCVHAESPARHLWLDVGAVQEAAAGDVPVQEPPATAW
jgi:hypothetical protein